MESKNMKLKVNKLQNLTIKFIIITIFFFFFFFFKIIYFFFFFFLKVIYIFFSYLKKKNLNKFIKLFLFSIENNFIENI